MDKAIRLLTIAVCIIIMITGCSKPQRAPQDMISITDMAGRSVDIPQKIDKVYSSGPIGTVFLYTLSPEKLAGWNHSLRDVEKVYIDERYHDLPALGTWRGTDYDGNVEELLQISPELIISMGDVDEKYTAEADAIQERLGIPVIMVDGAIQNSQAAYEFLGKVLKVEERAKTLGEYCENTVTKTTEILDAVTEDEKVPLYYAQGLKGLETEAKGSISSEILELAGAKNVADPGFEENVRRMEVSLEQLYQWDPEVIILSTDGDQSGELYTAITGDGLWKDIAAVREGEVYEIPIAPYDWINRPPSINRVIGIRWLANLLYPEIYNVDIREEVREFFSLFYECDLTPDEINKLLEKSMRR